LNYHIQQGDTIAKVTKILSTSWQKLKKLNPDAIGRSSKNGNWFLKQGAVVRGEEKFEQVLQEIQGHPIGSPTEQAIQQQSVSLVSKPSASRPLETFSQFFIEQIGLPLSPKPVWAQETPESALSDRATVEPARSVLIEDAEKGRPAKIPIKLNNTLDRHTPAAHERASGEAKTIRANDLADSITEADNTPGLDQLKDLEWVTYTVKQGDTLWDLAVRRFHVNLEDLVHDNDVADPRKLEIGTVLKIRKPSYPESQEVVASWYGDAYHGRPMANGDSFDMHAPTIAHRELPFGTRVELANPENGKTVQAVVTDRGPFIEGRDIDLSYGLAKKLEMVEKGVGPLVMRIIR